MKNIECRPPFIKLEQFLKLSNAVSTGGEAKIIILEEKVHVNGEICTMRGKKLRNGDLVEVDGSDEQLCCVIADEN